MTAPRAHVLAVGATSPAGMTATEAAMSLRAGRYEPRLAPFRDPTGRRSIGVARARFVPDDLVGYDRLVALAAPALREAAARLNVAAPLYLALPEPREDDDPRLGSIVADLAAAAKVRIDLDRSRVVRVGNAGFAFALSGALPELKTSAPVALVGGLDSFFHPALLRSLEEGFRLHGPNVANGVIPSEAAAFALLGVPAGAASRERPLCSIIEVGAGYEDTLGTDKPNLAKTMTELVRTVGAAARRKPVPWVVSDLNGERHRVTEWQRTAIRNTPVIAPPVTRHQNPYDDLGEIGAATGAFYAAAIATYWQTRASSEEAALMLLHSEGKERGVVLLEERS